MKATADTEPRWYIIHTYSSQEERVKKNLDLRVETMDVKDKIFDVVVPTEEEVEIRDGQKKAKRSRVFPGYVLVHMTMDDDSWYVVRNTPGVTGFVSAEDEYDQRPKPVPLDDHEVNRILSIMAASQPRVRLGLEKGQAVRITEGPFVDFMGVVDEVYPDRAKVKILVSFFGRETPVELDFRQVEKEN